MFLLFVSAVNHRDVIEKKNMGSRISGVNGKMALESRLSVAPETTK